MKEIMVITGGSSGLGYELVKEAIDRGYYVCNIARNKEKMDKLELEFKDNYKGFVGDISDGEFVSKSISEIKEIGNISYLINCADKGYFKKADEYTPEEIDLSLIGLKGMMICSTEVLKNNGDNKLKIINIMSSAALKGNKNETVYCAAKWGERGYTEALKAEYKGTNVKIVGVYPGGMNTSFWNESRDYVNKDKANTFMNPTDVAETILDNISYDSLNVADITVERL